MATAAAPQRGEIWLVRFGPSEGAEIRKIRPAIVASIDIGRLPLRIVVPVTDWKPGFAKLSWLTFLRATADNEPAARWTEESRPRMSECCRRVSGGRARHATP